MAIDMTYTPEPEFTYFLDYKDAIPEINWMIDRAYQIAKKSMPGKELIIRELTPEDIGMGDWKKNWNTYFNNLSNNPIGYTIPAPPSTSTVYNGTTYNITYPAQLINVHATVFNVVNNYQVPRDTYILIYGLDIIRYGRTNIIGNIVTNYNLGGNVTMPLYEYADIPYIDVYLNGNRVRRYYPVVIADFKRDSMYFTRKNALLIRPGYTVSIDLAVIYINNQGPAGIDFSFKGVVIEPKGKTLI